MQRYWGLSPEVGKALQRTVTVGCLATLVFLVPRYALLQRSRWTGGGGGESGAGPAVLYRLPGCAPGTGAHYGSPWESVDDRRARSQS